MKYQYENYDPSFPDQPVVDHYLPVWANLPSFRSKPAFIWPPHLPDFINTPPKILTYAQLNASTNQISSQLLVPLQRGDTVLLLCSPGLDFVELIFGTQRAGLLAVPIVPPHPSFANQNYHHLIRVISQTKPKAAIAHPHYITSITHYVSSSSHNNKKNLQLATLLQSITWISIEDLKYGNLNGNLSNHDHLTYGGCREDDVYLVQYTSGATGVPKPVLVTAGAAAHNVRAARKVYDLHPNSVIVSWLPQYHDAGLMFLLLTIVSGATCVLTSPTEFIKRPRLWLELMTKFKATCTPVPSFTLPLVLKRGGIDKGNLEINLSTLRNLILINEPIYRDTVEEFVDAFSRYGLRPSSVSPSYGLAENCTFVSTSWRSDTEKDSTFHDFPTHNKLLPVARLGRNGEEHEEDIEIVVVNEETREPVEDGVEGEIWISSPSNASGYLGNPNLTRQVFHGKQRNVIGKYFLRTGDTGIVKGDKQRYLFVTGRCEDVIKLQNGEKIHPHYIETAAYNRFPKILRGGCIAAFSLSATVAIVAELQRIENNGRIDDGVLRSVCDGIREAVLKKENVEVGWVVLVKSESIPKTTSGKLKRLASKEKLLAGKMKLVMELRFGKDDRTLKMARKVATEHRSSLHSLL